MKKKKSLIIIIGLFIALLLSIIIYYYFNKADSNTTLTIIEKQWIDNNKNKVIDFGIANDIPIFNYNGNGIFLDFLDSLEETTGLELNRMSYDYEKENNYEYSFKIVNEKSESDILLYQDNYVLVSNEDVRYFNTSEISNVTIGVLNNDVEAINRYLLGSNNISFKTYDNIDSLISSVIKNENGTSDTNMIAIPRVISMKYVLTNNLYVAYNVSEYTNNYVISLGKEAKLNSILKKYFEKWNNESLKDSYNKNFTNNYFELSNTDDKEVVSFTSKRYVYGFIENAPYDKVVNNNLKGINHIILKDFENTSGIELKYEKFDDIDSMVKAFNSNKIDFYLNTDYTEKYDMDVAYTASIGNMDVVILSNKNNNIIINSFNSLLDKTVLVIKNSKLEHKLTELGIKVKSYDNIEELISKNKKNSIIAVDYKTYYSYSNSFKNYKIDYRTLVNDNYSFISRDISSNKVFNKFLSFFILYNYDKKIENRGFYEIIESEKIVINYINIIVYLLAIIGIILIVYYIYNLINSKKTKKKVFNKDEKMKYIDMLTSLKNRNYLNDNIEVWDDSEIYPQTIVIVDLNNVAYINDNYGHQEGDNVIKEAANILIKTQIENTDIIRTNGNEFLIYLVGYDEKQVISYIRKLNKELKNIAHGFGAAVGYSMIIDAIKTIDDAINEATLDMRNNKEEANNN